MRIFRYLSSDVLSHTAAVAFVLFLVVFSSRFIRYLGEAAVGDLTADILLPVMLYKLPGFFELILPLSLFLGILLSLGRLYADSEMVILKACGVSPWRVALYVMPVTLGTAVLVALLALELAPRGSANAQAMLDAPRSAEGLQVLAGGRFKKQRGGNFVSYAERVDADGRMHNVFLVERKNDADTRLGITYAAEGLLKNDPDSGRRYLELVDGTRYRGVPGEPGYEVVQFERYGELIPEREGSLRSRIKLEAVPTAELARSDVPREQAALYWRLSLPVIVPIVSLIAIALSRTDARRGRYARLGPALLVFLVYFIGLTQTRSLVESGGGGWAMLLCHLLFAALAIVMLNWDSLSKRLAEAKTP